MLYSTKIINNIKNMLVARKQSLAVAESVTSGHMQAAFSAATLASEFFQGGITAYNLGQKCRHLKIEPISALNDDCVNELIACKMASEVNNLFLSNYGIAITGYATKVPEKNINELYAFFAIALNEKIIVTNKIYSQKENSTEVQIDFTNQVIREVEKVLVKAEILIQQD